MFQKLFFGAAAAVTAFALVLLGGVLAQVSGAVGDGGGLGNEAAVQAQAAQRAAAYQQVIVQANGQLAQAYQQQQTLSQQLDQAQQKLADTQQQLADAQQQAASAQQASSSSAAATTMTVDQAASLAQQLVPRGRILKQPVMVNLQGSAAYEIQFDLGTLYLDPTSGQVLAAVPASKTGSTTQPQGGDDN